MKLQIKPLHNQLGESRRGTLRCSYKKIVDVIGKPNATDYDDSDKVRASWAFTDQHGRRGFIWCYMYYGPLEKFDAWSIDGNPELFAELWGSAADWNYL